MRTRLILILVVLWAVHDAAADTYLNPSRGFHWHGQAAETGRIANDSCETVVRSVPLTASASDFSVATVITDLHPDTSPRYRYQKKDGRQATVSAPGYTLRITGEDGRYVSVNVGIEGEYDEFTTPRTTMAVESDGYVVALEKNPVGYSHGKSSTFRITRKGGEICVEYGHSELLSLATLDISDFSPVSVDVAVPPGGAVDVAYMHISQPERAHPLPERILPEEMAARIREAGSNMAGYWKVTGMQIEDEQLQPGGEYTFALLPDNADGFVLYYLAGATTAPSAWLPGMPKAVITPVASSRYDVEWIDATGRRIAEKVVAIISDDDLMTLYFSYFDNSQIVLQRVGGRECPAAAVTDRVNP